MQKTEKQGLAVHVESIIEVFERECRALHGRRYAIAHHALYGPPVTHLDTRFDDEWNDEDDL